MCSVTGVLAFRYAANAVDRAKSACMHDHTAAHGPDGVRAQIAHGDRIGLGHGPVATIDLSDASARPMVSAHRERTDCQPAARSS
jgi:asparagine synthetase B (glutamine-hydrolysing)